jgi:hypothetical protein
MKLVRIGPAGEEQPAVLADDGTLLDLTGLAGDIDGTLLATGLGVIRDAVAGGDVPPLSTVGSGSGARFGRPVLFLEATDTVIGPTDEVLVPRTSERTDDEVELALGRPGGGHLRPGDTLRLEIDGLGAQQQTLGTA